MRGKIEQRSNKNKEERKIKEHTEEGRREKERIEILKGELKKRSPRNRIKKRINKSKWC